VKTLGIRVQELADSIKEIGCKNTAIFIDACREAVQGAKGTASFSTTWGIMIRPCNTMDEPRRKSRTTR
jgi:hypothetical protein